jgi:tetratricopeptide (TPR) repeat protein
MRGSQKLKEAKSYVEQAPTLPNGYIDLGIAYDELGELDKALDAFKKAYNLSQREEDRFVVLFNIAAMYLNNGKPEVALPYAKQAQDINPSEDIVELISNIEHSMNTKSKPFWTNRKK